MTEIDSKYIRNLIKEELKTEVLEKLKKELWEEVMEIIRRSHGDFNSDEQIKLVTDMNKMDEGKKDDNM